jgi:predicted nucleic acid-binding protein
LLEAIADRRAELVLPAYPLAELRRVLVEKLKLAPDDADRAADLVVQLASTIAETPSLVPARSGDPDDDRIIAAALEAGAKILVSGDNRHILPLRNVGAMRILRPQEVLAELA